MINIQKIYATQLVSRAMCDQIFKKTSYFAFPKKYKMEIPLHSQAGIFYEGLAGASQQIFTVPLTSKINGNLLIL